MFVTVYRMYENVCIWELPILLVTPGGHLCGLPVGVEQRDYGEMLLVLSWNRCDGPWKMLSHFYIYKNMYFTVTHPYIGSNTYLSTLKSLMQARWKRACKASIEMATLESRN